MSHDADIAVRSIGDERQPLVVIDDFSADPEALRSAAIAAVFGPAAHHYPGIRAPLPADYLPAQQAVIAAALDAGFDRRAPVEVIDASFSIVTTHRNALSVHQRLPHCDAFAATRFAFIHYLARDDDDGTAFFRHRSTGFETIDEARRPIYFDQLEAELRRAGPPPAQYVSDDTPLFERTMLVEAKYNRALLYRSNQLHSGAISPGASLSFDPVTGRLTITGFLSVA